MTKTVYLIDETTGEYLGEYQAQESPLEVGVYITPEHSTDNAPLDKEVGFAMCFKEGEWVQVVDSRGVWYQLDGAEVEVIDLLAEIDGDWSRTQPAPTTSALTALKRNEISDAFSNAMQVITTGVPVDEMSSWSKQEAEARAFTANASAVTFLIDALATARGIDKALLITKIIIKADAFAAVSGQLIGKRQGLEDALDAAESDAEIAAVVWTEV